jgi:hypothetical protein
MDAVVTKPVTLTSLLDTIGEVFAGIAAAK